MGTAVSSVPKTAHRSFAFLKNFSGFFENKITAELSKLLPEMRPNFLSEFSMESYPKLESFRNFFNLAELISFSSASLQTSLSQLNLSLFLSKIIFSSSLLLSFLSSSPTLM